MKVPSADLTVSVECYNKVVEQNILLFRALKHYAEVCGDGEGKIAREAIRGVLNNDTR